jgi:serine/threonine protein kinase
MGGSTDVFPNPPTEIDGRYVLRNPLGSGARKTVYLAHDTKLNSQVVVALSRTDDIEGGSECVTEREAAVMGELRDLPHVVNVFDRGVHGPFNFLVLQHMAGGTLSDICRQAREEQRQLPISRVAWLGSELAEAVAELHAHNVIHRDIQPKNVWLDKEGGTLHLGDFDLALRVGETELPVTHARTNLGYIAPELGRDVVASYTSDLYSLGATLYELATLGRPFERGSEPGVRRRDATVEHPRQYRADLPEPLAALILELLEAEPEKRPASASLVRDALAAIAHAEESDVNSLIASGEGPGVEFKQSFRAPGNPPPQKPAEHVATWRKKTMSELEDECAIALAGFMNSKGGWLLIGVDDEGSIAGIEADYQMLQSRREAQSKQDLWELCFRDVMLHRLGDAARFSLAISFAPFAAGTVAVVRCERAAKETWVNKAEFYVRDGNRTQKLLPQDAMDYIRKNWPR